MQTVVVPTCTPAAAYARSGDAAARPPPGGLIGFPFEPEAEGAHAMQMTVVPGADGLLQRMYVSADLSQPQPHIRRYINS